MILDPDTNPDVQANPPDPDPRFFKEENPILRNAEIHVSGSEPDPIIMQKLGSGCFKLKSYYH